MNSKKPAYLAIGIISIIWGTTYIALSYGLDSLPPLFVSGGRQMLSGVMILIFCFFKGYPFPGWNLFKQILICGFLIVGLSNSLVTWSLNYVSSGMVAVLFTLVPIFICLITMFVLHTEKSNRWIMIGLILGLAGLFTLSWSGIARPDKPSSPMGLILLITGILAWSVGTIYSKRITELISPVFVAGIQLFVFGLFTFILSLAVEKISVQSIQPQSLLAISYLILFDSVIGYSCYLYALSKVPATVASLYAYVAPIVAVFAGWLLRDEKVTTISIFSSILIIVGVFIVEKGYAKNNKLVQ